MCHPISVKFRLTVQKFTSSFLGLENNYHERAVCNTEISVFLKLKHISQLQISVSLHTFPSSTSLASITMVDTRFSQIILQKSSTVLPSGPCEAIYALISS